MRGLRAYCCLAPGGVFYSLTMRCHWMADLDGQSREVLFCFVSVDGIGRGKWQENVGSWDQREQDQSTETTEKVKSNP